MLKKITIIVGILFVVLLVAAMSVPFLFKDKIETKLKTEINKSLNAKVDFSEVDLSVFKHFPKLTVSLKDLSVAGIERFEGDTLFAVKSFDLALDIMSVIGGGQIKISSIDLNSLRIHAI